jgi:hypothetical protein
MPEATDLIDLKMKIMRAERLAKRTGDRSDVIELRRQYAERKITISVRAIVAEWPPLTEDQRTRLRALFAAGGEHDDAA